MRRVLWAAGMLIVGFVVLLATADGALVTEVQASDSDNGMAFTNQRVYVGFIDANGSGHPDLVDPREPVYLDLDASATVSYGDLRLTPFGAYAADTQVDVSNTDAGRTLASAPGWFARATDGWVIDVDNSATLTAGDVRLAAGGPVQVTGSLATGDALHTQGIAGSLGVGAQPHVFYLDVAPGYGGAGPVAPGDLRIVPGPLAAEPKPQAPPAGDAATPSTTPAAAPGSAIGVPDSWRTLDWVIVALTVANLAGLAILARPQKPRNPFK